MQILVMQQLSRQQMQIPVMQQQMVLRTQQQQMERQMQQQQTTVIAPEQQQIPVDFTEEQLTNTGWNNPVS